jgi:hypothetical protein
MGRTIPGVLFTSRNNDGLVKGCTGIGNDFGLGAAQRPKLVVLPLKALILRENFEEGLAKLNVKSQGHSVEEGVEDSKLGFIIIIYIIFLNIIKIKIELNFYI